MKALVAILGVMALPTLGRSQDVCPGNFDPVFDAGTGLYSPHRSGPNPHFRPTSRLCGTNLLSGSGLWGWDMLSCIPVQSDGSFIVAGSFAGVRNVSRTGLARLHPDGSLDIGFAPTLTSTLDVRVRAVALRANGQIVIGGNFTTVDGQARPGLAQLHADGSLDTSFVPNGTNFVDTHALVITAGGMVVASSTFLVVQGETTQSVRGLVRFLPTGDLDNTFVPALPLEAPNPDGCEVCPEEAGGNPPVVCPDRAGGYDALPLLRGPMISLIELTEERLLVDGLVRLNADGSYDPTYVPEVPALFEVSSVVPQPDGRILLAGGVFTNADPTLIRELSHAVIRLNANGSIDPGFSPPTVSYVTGEFGSASLGARVILLQPDGKVVVGGLFTKVNEFPCGEVFRLNPDGSVDPSFQMNFFVNVGFDYEEVETVTALASTPEGKLLVGGQFQLVNGQSRSNLVQVFTGSDARPYQLDPSSLERTVSGSFRLQLHVPPQSEFSVQASTNLVDWLMLTNMSVGPVNGPITFEDTEAPFFRQRFYRLGPPACVR